MAPGGISCIGKTLFQLLGLHPDHFYEKSIFAIWQWCCLIYSGNRSDHDRSDAGDDVGDAGNACHP